MSQQSTIQLTTEQLQLMLDSVRSAAVAAANCAAPSTVMMRGTFMYCNSRLGDQHDSAYVEEFIQSVLAYKDMESISDEDALKSIAILFYGEAALWWLGVRGAKEVHTWDEAIALIREHFAPAKQAYQLYMEIFEEKQDDETAIGTFVCRMRAQLAQLPEGRHNEETELDMVYGLLNMKYRRQILRQDVKTFRDLLERGRAVEHNCKEVDVKKRKNNS
ncbi:activity-regulated cytoskeleton associated protein 1-like [Bactrocera neohumeralis]|uniref:activity-regulated cytoskeleton associated protein 1-like n=1 Tax=Bactrocera neohumeralis TaxID=98809 RepID=UPI0021668F55|nr:activity-regulated cytoskeleton associated protein 1-like [Bactrocera neohumeralis]